MSDVAELSLFEVDSLAVPTKTAPESATVRRTKHNNDLLARGIHPATGLALKGPHRCSGCLLHRYVNNGARSFHKCENHRLGMSRSEASDIRVSWMACTLFVNRILAVDCSCDKGWRDLTSDELASRPKWDGAKRKVCELCNGRGMVVP